MEEDGGVVGTFAIIRAFNRRRREIKERRFPDVWGIMEREKTDMVDAEITSGGGSRCGLD